MLAIKYRPLKFSDVSGQDIPKETLKRIVESNLPVRAILLQGEYGCGKTTLSRIFARALRCENYKKIGDVCNECDSCRQMLSGNSQAYFEYDATKVGNIESIRNMIETLQYQPIQGRRVVVIDEVHTASTAAQSALLKILEDGIRDVTFVFATTDSVLPTIKSRSLFLELTQIPHNLIVERLREICKLEKIEITDESLYKIAVKSNGHMRDALSVLDHYAVAGESVLKTSYESFKKFIRAALKRESIDESLSEVLQYPILDIANTISQFTLNCITGNGDMEAKLQQRQFGIVLMRYFYRSEVRNAMKEELGVEIVLRAFAELRKQ